MLEEAHHVAVAAAREAGASVRSYFRDEYTVRDKGENNPLTDADLAANEILQERLQDSFPDYGWLSEETTDSPQRLQKERVWIVDPLDGTREFISGIPEFVVSIGLVLEERAVLGVLYNPINDFLITGIVGIGAAVNGTPVRVSDRTALEGAEVVCSRTEMNKGWFERYAENLIPKPVGSVAYKFGLVAAGMADATFTPRPRSEWDICAGAAIVEAAGGRTSNRHGKAHCFNQSTPTVDGVVASNGRIHEDILHLMNQ